ncbi:hypothetical protein Salat_1891000 [Sesamum alatum]|uniref:Uncharacterized protein n=1 Tax=Sesamum alatum TaxID=300844 RepID=A0AAE1Y3L9_9LAMI|nr:hypothetical protein Salat_1891000 [Sesamum alatum]
MASSMPRPSKDKRRHTLPRSRSASATTSPQSFRPCTVTEGREAVPRSEEKPGKTLKGDQESKVDRAPAGNPGSPKTEKRLEFVVRPQARPTLVGSCTMQGRPKDLIG